MSCTSIIAVHDVARARRPLYSPRASGLEIRSDWVGKGVLVTRMISSAAIFHLTPAWPPFNAKPALDGKIVPEQSATATRTALTLKLKA